MLYEGILLLAATYFGAHINSYLNQIQNDKNKQDQINLIVWKVENNLSMNPIVQHQIYYSDNDGNNGEHAMIQKIVKELLNIDAIKSENSKGSQKDGTGNDSNSPGKNALLKKKTEFQTNNGSKIQKQAIDNSKNRTEGPQNTENSYSKDYSKKQSQKTILTWNKQDFKGYSIQLARIGYEYLTDLLNFLEEIFIPPVYLIMLLIAIMLIATIHKIWKSMPRRKHVLFDDVLNIDTMLQIIEKLQKEHNGLKSAMEQYAIESNDKMRYMLMKIISQQEQLQTINKEYEDNVMFRFLQYSTGLMTRVKIMTRRMKVDQRNSKIQKISQDKQLLEMKSELRNVTEVLKKLEEKQKLHPSRINIERYNFSRFQ